MNFKYFNLLFIILIIFTVCMGASFAENMTDMDLSSADDEIPSEDILNVNEDEVLLNENSELQESNSVQEDEIVVNDWEDLQYYCSLEDKNYTVKLKEYTNFYPTDPSDPSYQIQVKNNVKIIGNNESYIGDNTSDARRIAYSAIFIEDNSKIGITLENITFKWISTDYQNDGVFLTMGGNAYNSIKNCYFYNITTYKGHSCIVYLKRGDATLENCTFINCTTDFGCVSIYDPLDNTYGVCNGARMMMYDCYFENNHAKIEPGCINNCGFLIVYNTTFYRNSAGWWAGAIHTHCGANTTLYNSDFIDNVAGWNGGALYTYSWLQIYNSTFKGNNCTTNNGGGAIGACWFGHSPFIHIENSLFEDNENTCWELGGESTTTTGRGGAISIMDDGLLEVFNSTFIKNSASIGTAICALEINYSGKNLPLDVRLIGNKFINHTRKGEVLDVHVGSKAICDIQDNYYQSNSIKFSKLNLIYSKIRDNDFLFNIEANLSNPNVYDEDILDKCKYDVYVNGIYLKTVNSTQFSLNGIESSKVYVIPSIGIDKSNIVEVIVQKNSSVLIEADDIEYGQNQIINFTVTPNNATGNLTVLINNLTYTVYLSNPKLDLGILDVGKYNINVSYNGDLRYYPSINNTSFTVNKKVMDNTVIENVSNTISIKLPSDSTGNLTVYVDNKTFSEKLVNGSVTVTINDLRPGTYNVDVVYSGDNRYASISKNITVTIDKIPTALFSSNIITNYGNSAKMVATLKDNNNNLLSGKNINILLNGVKYTKTTDSKGQVSLTTPSNLAVKTYSATITFEGDDEYIKSTVTSKLIVNKAASKITANKKTFKAKTKVKKYTITLKSGKKVIKKVQVSLKIKGKTYKVKTNTNGKATFKINKLTKKGTYTAVIKFKGNKSYKASTKKVKITIKK